MDFGWRAVGAGSADAVMKRLAGKTAVITGGSKGMGRGIVEAFIREGAKVLTCGRGGRPDDLPEAAL